MDTGILIVAGDGPGFQTFTGTLNYAHALGGGTTPYVTLGAGLATLGGDAFSSSENFLIYGLSVGHRQRLAHGHCSIRVEARYDRVDPKEPLVDALNVIGLRVGFDLDLN